MRRFDRLTQYLPMIASDSIGKWVIDEENDGTPAHPIQMPYVDYSEVVQHFMADAYALIENDSEMELSRYQDILEKYGIGFTMEGMKQADVSSLDAEGVLALIIGILRADRFSEGTLMAFFHSGSMLKWLEQLKDIDEGEGDNEAKDLSY